MKINLQNNEEFDNFFRRKYKEDEIKPQPELWDAIKHKNIYSGYHHFSKFTIAVVTAGVVLISAIAFLEIPSFNAKFIKNSTPNSTQILSNSRDINKNENKNNRLSNKRVENSQVIVKDNNATDKNISFNKDYVTNKTISKNVQVKGENDRLIYTKILDKQNIEFENITLLIEEYENQVYIKTFKVNIENKRNKNVGNKMFRKKFSLGISFTPHYSYRTLYNNVAYPVPDVGKAYFNNHENGSFGFSTGLQLFYELNTKWKFFCGIEYYQYAQKMDVSSFAFKPNGQNGYYTYTSIGRNDITISSSVPISAEDFLKSSTTYSFLNISVNAEYKLTKHYFINGGIGYKYLFDKNVNWQAENYNGDFSNSTSNISGVKTGGFSFIIGAGYERYIHSGLSFIINPQFSTFFTSITDKMPVKTYPFSLGIKLGLRYKI